MSGHGDILVVDDTPANLELLASMLRERGYTVRLAPSGRVALMAVEARRPDLVLLDINMPEMDGYEVCRRLRAGDRPPPVLFLSAMTGTSDRVRAFDAGGVDYVSKPFQVEEVIARVETQLTLGRLQRETEDHAIELEQANAKLREVEALRAELANAIVHDLKNPLNGILLNTGWMLSKLELQPAAREAVEDMRSAASTMHRMVLGLLDAARAAGGGLQPNRQVVRLRDLIALIEPNARLYARGASRVVRFELGMDLQLSFDLDLVARVLENLVDNALKYSPSGTEILVDLSASADDTLRARVVDHGAGVPVESRARVFEPFARVDKGLGSGDRLSHGLGLAFCRRAVEAHGGKLWIEDVEPTGSAFCLEIPARVEP